MGRLIKVNTYIIILNFFAVLIILSACSSGPDLSEWNPKSENVANLKIITDSEGVDSYPTPLGDGDLLFSSTRQGNFDVWSTGLGSGGSVQLTNYSGPDKHPAPHPNGDNFTFVSSRGGDVAYYMGHRKKPLATRLTEVSEPDFSGFTPGEISSDSSRMVYSSGRHIWTYNLDTDRKTQITTGYYPTWHPNNEDIIFVRKSEGNTGLNTSIWRMNRDGTQMTEIITSPEEALIIQPDVSPNGEKICYVQVTLEVSGDIESFARNQEGNLPFSAQAANFDVFVSDSNGQNSTRLTTHPLMDVEPRWINRDEIAFSSWRPQSGDIEDANWNIWVLSL